MKTLMKFMLSIFIDVLDFIFGWLDMFGGPAGILIGNVWDILTSFLAQWMWGKKGILAYWEVFEFTNKIDLWIPTLTIIGMLSLFEQPAKTATKSIAEMCRAKYSTKEEIERCINGK